MLSTTAPKMSERGKYGWGLVRSMNTNATYNDFTFALRTNVIFDRAVYTETLMKYLFPFPHSPVPSAHWLGSWKLDKQRLKENSEETRDFLEKLKRLLSRLITVDEERPKIECVQLYFLLLIIRIVYVYHSGTDPKETSEKSYKSFFFLPADVFVRASQCLHSMHNLQIN